MGAAGVLGLKFGDIPMNSNEKCLMVHGMNLVVIKGVGPKVIVVESD